MSAWGPFLGLALPLFLAIIPFNIVAFQWGLLHGNKTMPDEISLKSQKMDRYAPWLRDGVLLLLVLSLRAWYSISPSQIGLRIDGWQSNLLLGILACSLQMGLQALVWRLLTSRGVHAEDESLIRRSLVRVFFSVCVEQLWMAFCVATLRLTGHSASTSVALTAAVFGVAHLQYRFGAFATALYGAVFACLFVWRGSLVPSFLMHLVGNTSAFFWARRAARRVAQP